MKNIVKLISFFSFCLICFPEVSGQTYTIYPIPQQMSLDANSIEITSEINVIKETSVDESTWKRLEEVLSGAGYTWTYSSNPTNAKTNLYIGINGSKGPVDTYMNTHTLPRTVFDAASNKFDPYFLQLNQKHEKGDIIILGDAGGSAYYALATLEQLLEQGTGKIFRQVTFQDYAYTKYRGIVEGFYGRPWTVENRLSLLDYCKRYKMNTFIYGPKSDPYHLGYWKNDYPVSISDRDRYFGLITQDDIRKIAAKAKACNVDFIWAAHPAMQNGISFSSQSTMDPGITSIMDKFDHLYGLGVRGFGVFIDDISYTPSGTMQAYLADQVHKKLQAKYNTATTTENDKVTPLFFVPTAYALNYGGSSSLTSLKTVDPDAVILFTGYDCFSNIRGSACQDMANRVGRNAVMWWNNPVNDDHDDRIYMREVTAHWRIEDSNPIPSMHGLVLNPMNQAQVSKVSLFGGADYGWNPSKFNTSVNWSASFSSIIRNQPALENALKVFALSSNSTIEEENLKQLYTAFKSAYSKGNLPAVTDDLLREMAAINEACKLLQSMKNSEIKDEVLLYEDIRCWLAKLESMTHIIKSSLNLMKNAGQYSSWTDYLEIRKEYNKLHTDSAFFVSSFEDSGTSTFEKYYEVHPSQGYMEPFVDYIAGKIEDYAPELPERSRNVEVITNIENLSQVSVADLGEKVRLSGLNALSLKKGEYVGIYLNAIKEVTVPVLPVSLTEKLTVEYSVNGKEWTAFIPDGLSRDMAYFRLKNTTGIQAAFDIGELEIMVPVPGKVTAQNILTNMSPYQTYSIQRVIDGNYSTYFWSNAPQKVGDYVTLVFASSVPRYEIRLCFTKKDCPTGTVAVELSEDNANWEELTTFTQADLSAQSIFTCNAGGKPAKYIRFHIKSITGGEWLQFTEFEADGSRAIPVAYDQDGNPISVLDDRKLSAGYKAKGAGYLVYRFVENISIEEIQVFHVGAFIPEAEKPSIMVCANGQWIDQGKLNDPCTKINVRTLTNISELKISWNGKNIPDIYEILPLGEKYVEQNTETTHRQPEASLQTVVLVSNHIIEITASFPIHKVTVWDIAGSKINEVSPAGTHISIPVDKCHHILLVGVESENGIVKVQKLTL